MFGINTYLAYCWKRNMVNVFRGLYHNNNPDSWRSTYRQPGTDVVSCPGQVMDDLSNRDAWRSNAQKLPYQITLAVRWKTAIYMRLYAIFPIISRFPVHLSKVHVIHVPTRVHSVQIKKKLWKSVHPFLRLSRPDKHTHIVKPFINTLD